VDDGMYTKFPVNVTDTVDPIQLDMPYVRTTKDPYIRKLLGSRVSGQTEAVVVIRPRNEISNLIARIHKPFIKLMQTWVINLFWGDGYFHADLHPGNIFVPPIDKLDAQADVYVLDYGSFGRLKKRAQCKLIDAVMMSQRVHQMHFYIPDKKYKHIGTVPKESDEIKELLTFYKRTTLTDDPRKGLIRNLVKNNAYAHHLENIRIVELMLPRLARVCNVQADDELAIKLLEYHKWIGFLELFINFVEHAADIGTCTSDSTLLFGRGFAYIGTTSLLLEKMCPEFCVPFSYSAFIPKFLVLNRPRQLINMARGEAPC
jgi:hypothetical protein